MYICIYIFNNLSYLQSRFYFFNFKTRHFNIQNYFQIIFLVNLMFIGPCIILIVEE